MDREDTLDADAEAHAADGECGRRETPAPRNHHAFERLDALFFLALFALFAQAHVDAHRVAGIELGNVRA